MNRNLLFLIIFVFLFLYSCRPVSEVHQYSTTSVAALNKINELDYTFSDYCRQDCELQQVRKAVIDPTFRCNCVTAANADSAIQKIHTTLTAYMEAIGKLSNNEDFTYDVSGLMEAVQKSTLLELSDQQVSVSTKAGNFIATAATSYYRRKKLNQYLGGADSLFQDLAETLIYLVDSRLRAQLGFQYNARIPHLKQMLDDTQDKGVKQMAVKQYLEEKAYYEKHGNLLDTYVALLKSVQKGHHELYLHRHNLRDGNTKDVLQLYIRDLNYILATLK
jgi:hypothetical protein